jgi:hypothetical protein
VGGGDVAQRPERVAGDPGGDLGLSSHVGSKDSMSALESPGIREREQSERERLSCYTEQSEGGDEGQWVVGQDP